jgi:hypothetical protein
MDTTKIWQLFEPLYDDIQKHEHFPPKRPILAHYTSLDVVEKILKTDEVWFSNPLFMNDLEEVRFGFIHGIRALKECSAIKDALKTAARFTRFLGALDHYVNYYEREHLLDTYVFCLSEQAPEDRDGRLSMWRGYGGNGKGAALVFDTAKLTYLETSPMILAPVQYGSSEERYNWCERTASFVASVLDKNHLPDDDVHIATAAAVERIKLFALFTKHHGFKEENEWRVVYMSDRDSDGRLKPMLHYFNGPRGVEPKLRFKVEPVEGITAPDLSFEKLLHAVLLGPSTSSLLAQRSVARMLELIGKPKLKDRLYASSIPFRAL